MPPDTSAHAMQAVAALSVMIIIFWMTEALPLAVTGLLPLVVLPLLHITGLARVPVPFTLAAVSPNYANPSFFFSSAVFCWRADFGNGGSTAG